MFHKKIKKMNKVEKQFIDKGIFRNNILLLTKSVAIDFVDECKKNKFLILGIDSFILFNEKIQPSLENSVDYTIDKMGNPLDMKDLLSEDFYKKAKMFIKEKNDHFVFEICCKQK